MVKEIKKLVQDGEVAVIYSPCYGLDLDSAAEKGCLVQMRFDPDVAKLILEERAEEAADLANDRYGCESYPSFSGLKVSWIPVGISFVVTEYDGYESIEFSDLNWLTA